MEGFFNAIVHVLNEICRSTGFSYFEINILLYTFLIPVSWWTIVWWKLRKHTWVWIPNLGVPISYVIWKDSIQNWSEQFYNANTDALLRLADGDEMGYIRVSILVGVLFPALIYLGLWLFPKRWLMPYYIGLWVVNLMWYGWVLSS